MNRPSSAAIPQAIPSAFERSPADAAGERWFWIGVAAMALLAAAIRLAFWLYTGRVWEDALITILHAENARQGLGLTHYKVDEGLVHGFTSPLSVLIPLLGEWIRPGFGLDFMRWVSIACAPVTIYLAALLMRRPGLRIGTPLSLLVLGYLAIEHHQMLWGMAGMETQVVTAIILFSLYAFVSGRTVLLGVSLGLCMLVRPDLAFWAAMVGVVAASDAWHTRHFRQLWVLVGVSLCLYLPWVLFATAYYGNPIPNTIHAKSAGYGLWWKAVDGSWPLARTAWQITHDRIFAPLGPSFGGNGTGFQRLPGGSLVSGVMIALVVAGTVGLVVGRRRTAMVGAFLTAYFIYYLIGVPNIFGWYLVPFNAVAVILAAKGISLLVRRLPAAAAGVLEAAICVAYLGLFAWITPATAKGERDIQRFVEAPVRIEIGKWLRANTPADTTIGGESLGFLGYYSRRTYYDYPGLASRHVVDFVRGSGMPGLPYMLWDIRPDYLVLRDMELAGIASSIHERWFRDLYEPVKKYEVSPEHERRLLVGGNIDEHFTLFRRRYAVARDALAWQLPADARIAPSYRATLFGDFVHGGFAPRAPAGEGAVYGSWRNADTNQGQAVIPLGSIPALEVLAVPFITGPAPYGQKLEVYNTRTGAVLASLHTLHDVAALPVSVKSWKYWLVDLPPNPNGDLLAVRATDGGRGWGEWMGVGLPRLVPRSFYNDAKRVAEARPGRAPQTR